MIRTLQTNNAPYSDSTVKTTTREATRLLLEWLLETPIVLTPANSLSDQKVRATVEYRTKKR